MKVLIITYYWPPAGGSGVQRWLKFVKYLQDFGIEPVVYTVLNPTYVIEDKSFLDDVPKSIEVIRQPIHEPNSLFSFLKNKSTNESAGFLNPNPSLFGKVIQYIRANYFIPDARKFWIKPSVKFLTKYLSENDIGTIITTGPPHSMHMIGLELKKRLSLQWITDFRDPWTEIDYFKQLPLTEKSIKKHHQLEKEVLKNSDTVIVVGENMKKMYSNFSSNIHVITNGFDSNNDYLKRKVVLSPKFTITHVGLMNNDRNPIMLWKVIADICSNDKGFQNDLEIRLIGKLAKEVNLSISDNVIDKVITIDHLPHDQVIKHQKESQVLLVTVNNVPSAKGIITGKVFEYLHAKRPILAIGPTNGDLANILKETNSGIIVNFDDAETLKSEILMLYKKFKDGNLSFNSKNIDKYHRRTLTEKLSKIIKERI